MTENIFSAVLTLSLLAGGTIAFGSEVLGPRQASAATQVATLPPVTVIGHRIAANDRVTLPTVVVTGHRCEPTEIAVETDSVEQRVQ